MRKTGARCYIKMITGPPLGLLYLCMQISRVAYLRKKIDDQFVERLNFWHSTKLAELVVAWNAVFPTALNGNGSQIGSVRFLATESKPI